MAFGSAVEGAGVTVEAGQLSRVASGQPPTDPEPVDTRYYTAWREGALAFDDAPLSQVLLAISRRFDIPTKIEPPELAQERIHLYTKTTSLNEALPQKLGFVLIYLAA